MMAETRGSERRVLVIEDESDIRDLLSYNLASNGYEVQTADTGQHGLDAIESFTPDVVLLDLMLPDVPGTEICRRIRANTDQVQPAIIMLTAKGEEIDRVVGLEMGADDYIVKPFSLRELVARVRMVMRRGANSHNTNSNAVAAPVTSGRFQHDSVRKQLSFCGQPLDLTLHEYQLLEALLQHPGRVYTRAQLLDQAWEAPDHRLDRTVDSHIKSLRAKLREVNAAADPIRTHRGMGYSLDIDA